MRWLIRWMIKRYLQRLQMWAVATEPDLIIGGDYLLRWYLIRDITNNEVDGERELRAATVRSRWMNAFLHCVARSDDDRALHDHPWLNISIILQGTYREVFADRAVLRRPGDIVFRIGSTAHRLEVVDGPVWSLFITGPKYREWGFRCHNGWRHWKEFTRYNTDGDSTRVGRGCGE